MFENPLLDRFDAANVRIEKLIWIPGAIGAASIPDDLEEVFEDVYGNQKQIIEKDPSLSPLFEDESREEDDILMLLAPVEGFFVKFGCPIPDFMGDGEGFSFSWGYYATAWYLASDLEEITTLAETFGEETKAKAREKRNARLG